MKKLFTLLIILCSTLNITADIRVRIDGVQYVLNDQDHTASVTHSGDYVGKCVIPSIVINDGISYDVIQIEVLAFGGCFGLTAVDIPNSVMRIGNSAFDNCSNLTSIVIGKGVTYIGRNAFEGCSGVTDIAWNAVACSSNWQKDESPFKDATNITSFVFGDEVEVIPAGLCANLSSITELTIPASVKTIEYEAFYGCTGLESVHISDVAAWCNATINSNPLLYAHRLFLNDIEIRDLVIPSGVTNIKPQCFYGCKNLTSVAIPNTVTSIGSSAFANCSSLTSVNIPNGVTTIGEWTFSGCTSLTSINIPNTVTSIGEAAFRDCSSVNRLTIGTNVATIGGEAFAGCTALSSVTWNAKAYTNTKSDGAQEEFLNPLFPNASNIRSFVFGNEVEVIPARLCKGLIGVTSIHIPNSITSIGTGAFYNCSSLTSINIPNNIVSIGIGAFYNCSSLTSINIPNNIASIEEYTFFKCSALRNITIGKGVTYIANNAFENCSGLQSVTWNAKECSFSDIWWKSTFEDARNSITSFVFGEEVKVIPSNICRDLSLIKSINIPNSVVSIGDDAFSGCTGLESVHISDVAAWCNATINSNPLLYAHRLFLNDIEIRDLVIPSGVTNIKPQRFYGCKNLTSVAIPNTVTSIGSSAFANCSSLTSVNIPNGITSIEEQTFSGCTSLTSINIPNTVTSIGGAAFRNCTSLANLNVPNSVTSIEGAAFNGCSGLTSVNISSGITSIESWTFEGCSNLTTIKIPDSVTTIGERAFSGCTSLTSINIPNSITSIGSYAFEWCESLTGVYINDITSWCKILFNNHESNPLSRAYHLYLNDIEIHNLNIPNSITSINAYAFAGGINMMITVPNSVTNIGENAFDGVLYVAYQGPAEGAPWGARFYNAYMENGIIYEDSAKEKILSCVPSLMGTAITIPNSVTSIENDAFRECSNITSVIWNAKSCSINRWWSSIFESSRETLTSILFGDEVEVIPPYLCKNLTSLTSVSIPNNIKSIGERAFEGCTGLISVNIPNTVTNIENEAFNQVLLISYYGSATGAPWGAKYYNKYLEDYLIYEDNTKSTILYCLRSVNTPITIPRSVTKIEYEAFRRCYSLAAITIPANVTDIGWNAFEGCTGLTDVNIQNSVIGSSQFKGCTGLTSITIPANVKEIGGSAFEDCTGLTSITIPENVTNIGWAAFDGCSNLSSVVWNAKQCNAAPFGKISDHITSFKFGDKVELIPSDICSGMFQLTSVTIPSTVSEIGSNAFSNCSELTKIAIPNSVTNLGSSAFSGCTGLIYALIGDYVSGIDNYTFSNCSSLESVTIGKKVALIGDQAFSNCSKLTSITLPNSVKTIGYEAFYNCSKLEIVTLGTDLESISNYAFEDCKKILDIYSYAKVVPEIEKNTFKNVSRKAYVWVPSDMIRRYEIDEYWDDFFIKPLGAKEATTDGKVNIQPGDNNAVITWPTSTYAAAYSLTISKDGEVFCILTFNSNGQLTGIAFAPSRNGDANAPSAQLTAQGYQFTVTGLNPGTAYTYQIDATDTNNHSVASYKGSFVTTGGYQAVDLVETNLQAHKILRDGQIFILCGDKTYTITGQEVK